MGNDPREALWGTLAEALAHHGDQTSRTFYARLRERRFSTTQCEACDALFFPPRPACPECSARDASRGGRIRWVDLSGRGTLHAFSQNHQALFFGKPDVIGLVDLEEGCGRVLSRIDAVFEDLRIGQSLRVDFLALPAGLTLHQFRPAPARDGARNE